jgi:dienelactone hydrolase
MIGTRVSYLDEQQPLDGYLAAPDSARHLPGVLVVPSWRNVDESICRRADRLAELGYAAFVADLFGAGVRPAPPQSPMTLVGPFLDDRLRFRRRLSTGLTALQQRPECNADCIAAIGYCIGGCGVLELARAAAPLRGVVSLHGILSTTMAAQPKTVVPKILVLHGDADPVVPLDSVIAFREEMRLAQANWQMNIYGGAKHSFTGEGAAGDGTREAGLHPQTEARSWQMTVEFLREVFQIAVSPVPA